MATRNPQLAAPALGACLAACVFPAWAAAQPAELPAKIVTLAGHADVSRKAAPAWTSASLRDELVEGDGVRTLGGHLTLRLSSGQALRLGPRTQVFFVTSDSPSTPGSTRVRMDGGRLWSSTRANSPLSSQIELRAGPVTATARGGGTGVVMNPDGSVLVSVYHGMVTCAGAEWQRALVQDQALLVTAEGAPTETAALKRDKRDADWIKWNEQQDAAGGYGVRRADK